MFCQEEKSWLVKKNLERNSLSNGKEFIREEEQKRNRFVRKRKGFLEKEQVKLINCQKEKSLSVKKIKNRDGNNWNVRKVKRSVF